MSVVINGSAGVTTNSGAVYNGISAGTAVASTSGTSINFTSIPSWVKRVTVMFNGVSTNGTSSYLVQLGYSGGIVSTGYVSSCGTTQNVTSGAVASSSSGMIISSGSASNALSGAMVITLLNASSNIWCENGGFCNTVAANVASVCGGVVTLSGTLDRVRITTVNGTDTFDAGSINILYE